jgi:hypothetical protein
MLHLQLAAGAPGIWTPEGVKKGMQAGKREGGGGSGRLFLDESHIQAHAQL